MGRLAHVDSYYAASAHPAPDRPALAGSISCDVCVVGGGIAGCSAALHLAERGYDVVLLEEQRIGWGSSGRSGAQAIHGVAAGQANWGKMDKVIAMINDARRQGMKITADMYTYPAGATGLDASMPPWVEDGGYEAMFKGAHPRIPVSSAIFRLHRKLKKKGPLRLNEIRLLLRMPEH